MSGGRPRKPVQPLTDEERKRVEAVLPMLRRMARALARRRPGADVDALEGAAIEAVSASTPSYDRAKNDCFEAFAWSVGCRAMQAALPRTRSLSPGLRAGTAHAAALRAEADPYDDAEDGLDRRVAQACDETSAAYTASEDADVLASGGEDDLIAEFDNRRNAAAFWREVERRPEADRRLIELRLRDHRSFRSIGEELGLSRAKASRRVHELLSDIQKVLCVPAVPRAAVGAARAQDAASVARG